MNAAALEAFLARLYTDEGLRRAFLARPDEVLRSAGLDESTQQALRRIDREGLVLAAHSLAARRAPQAGTPRRAGLWQRLLRRVPGALGWLR